MARHFTISIRVAYDVAHPIPDDMMVQLKDNVTRCVTNAELLNDSDLEAVVEDWRVQVEEGTA